MLKRMVQQAVTEKIGSTNVVESFREAYDYVIVGAGAAGNVLANRLTECGSHSVLVLEAGGDDTKKPSIHIPTSAPELQQSEFDYSYKSVPQQRACRGLNNKQALYPRGRGLGGSSSINYLAYMRGSRYDFDEWEELGCKGWSYRDVLRYFIKSECNSNSEYLKSGYHGKSGPLKIEDLEMTPLVEAFLAAGQDLGYGHTDINGANQLGFSNVQGLQHKGMRWSTAHAYLRPIMERSNLDIAINAQVNKLEFDKNQVTGVEINHGDQVHSVKVNREVLLSAGAIESPKLLMLSGIGPKEHLAKFQIPIRSNLPVGENFQDHPVCVLEYNVEKPPTLNVDRSAQSPSHKDYSQYLFFTQGYLGMPGAQGGLAFLRTRMASSQQMYPDILMQMSCSLINGIFKDIWNMKGEVFDTLYGDDSEEPKTGMYLTTTLLHPKSRGHIRLHSKDPTDKPIIDPKFLDDSHDAKVMVEGLKLQLQLQETPAFKRIGASLSRRAMPGNKEMEVFSDDYLDKFVRHQTLTGHHAVGSCQMGPLNKKSSVVDPELRVIGIKGLRVVDASVMPRIPSAATSAPTVMIAEKAADLILGRNSVEDIILPEEVLAETQYS